MPRTFGHQKGAKTLQEIIRISSSLGIKYLTVQTKTDTKPAVTINNISDINNEKINLQRIFLK